MSLSKAHPQGEAFIAHIGLTGWLAILHMLLLSLSTKSFTFVFSLLALHSKTSMLANWLNSSFSVYSCTAQSPCKPRFPSI